MKVLHIDFSGPYTIGATYQENILPVIMARMGNDVAIWTSGYSWKGNNCQYIGEKNEILDDGVRLRRWKYKKVGSTFLSSKIRAIDGFFSALQSESPDFIMLHDAQTAIVPELCKYLDMYPKTIMVVDSHSDCYNSATNLFSDFFLHRIIYKRWMRKAYKYARAYFPLSPESEDFITNEYDLPKEKMRILPLGGEWHNDQEYYSTRGKRRNEIGANENTIILVHSGKLTEGKKTDWVLDTIKHLSASNILLLIIGSAEGKIQQRIAKCSIDDKRIKFLGWKTGAELQEYLCAGDIYISPGTQSATVQVAMCCRCVPVVWPYKNYTSMLGNNGFFASSKQELIEKIEYLISDSGNLVNAKFTSSEIAKKSLDYYAQAEMILSIK